MYIKSSTFSQKKIITFAYNFMYIVHFLAIVIVFVNWLQLEFEPDAIYVKREHYYESHQCYGMHSRVMHDQSEISCAIHKLNEDFMPANFRAVSRSNINS